MKKEEQLAPSLDLDSRAGAGRRGPEILNENHRLQLRYTFQCIDSVLTEIEQILADPERKSPFSPYTSDVTLTQRRQLRSWFRKAIINLRSAFISAAGIHRIDLEPLDADLLSDRAQIAADLEHLKRASWNRPNNSTIAEFPARR